MDFVTEHKKNFKRELGRQIGPYAQPYTVKEIADLTGLGEGTIRTHIDPFGSLPSLPHVLIYFKVLGVDFADAILSYVGFTIARADEHEAPTTHEAQIMLAELMREIIVALEDGHLSDEEKAKLTPIFRKAGQSLVAWANEYEADQ